MSSFESLTNSTAVKIFLLALSRVAVRAIRDRSRDRSEWREVKDFLGRRSPDSSPGYCSAAPSALKKTYLNELVKKAQSITETVPKTV
jgi:hypothetical protein